MRNRGSFISALILAGFTLACGDDNNNAGGGNGGGGNGGGGGTGSSPVPMAITIQGRMGDQSFSPATATVRVGQIVEWRNEDYGKFDTGDIATGTTSRTLRMDVAGTFPYHCTIHPGMTGTIVVTP